MRKIYILLACLASFSLVLNGQIKLTYNSHSLVIGTSHDFIFTKNVDEGTSGSNVIWDFSGLQPIEKTLTSHMLDPVSLDKSSEIPEANTVIEEFGNYFYFKVQNDIMEQYGTVCCNTVIKYDKPFLKIKFPFTYGDKETGSYSGVQESADSKTPVSGNYEVSADAYGTLILPNVTLNNVLRVKQSRTIDYGNGNVTTEITFRWYTANVRYPILVIIKYITPKSTYVAETALYAHAGEQAKSAAEIQTPELLSNLDAYPNPYDDNLTISYNLGKPEKVKIEIYDASGNIFKNVIGGAKQDAGVHNMTINTTESNFKPGIYYVRVTINETPFTKKVVKAK